MLNVLYGINLARSFLRTLLEEVSDELKFEYTKVDKQVRIFLAVHDYGFKNHEMLFVYANETF